MALLALITLILCHIQCILIYSTLVINSCKSGKIALQYESWDMDLILLLSILSNIEFSENMYQFICTQRCKIHILAYFSKEFWYHFAVLRNVTYFLLLINLIKKLWIAHINTGWSFLFKWKRQIIWKLKIGQIHVYGNPKFSTY